MKGGVGQESQVVSRAAKTRGTAVLVGGLGEEGGEICKAQIHSRLAVRSDSDRMGNAKTSAGFAQ